MSFKLSISQLPPFHNAIRMSIKKHHPIQPAPTVEFEHDVERGPKHGMADCAGIATPAAVFQCDDSHLHLSFAS